MKSVLEKIKEVNEYPDMYYIESKLLNNGIT